MDKKREPKKITFIQSIIILLLVIAILIWGALIAKIPTGMGLLYSTIFLAIVGYILGYSWDDMFKSVLSVVNSAMPAVFILVLVGFVTASWIACGTIPYIIYKGVQIINPSMFLLTAFLLTGIVSLATGSSWAIVTAFGIAMAGIGNGLGINPAITAGAVVSGTFLGDKWSPLSDTPNLAAATTGQNIINLFSYMLPTSGIGAILAAIIFGVLGISIGSGNIDVDTINLFTEGLSSSFNLNIILLLPVILVCFMAFKKLPIIPVLITGVGVGAFLGIIIQGINILDMTNILWSGYVSNTGIEVIDGLLTRGGITSMMSLVLLLLCAFTFAGVMEKIGILEAIMDKLLTIIKTPGTLVLFTVITSIIGVFLTSSVYVSIILNGRMYMEAYKEMKLDPINLSRATLTPAAYMGALCPWSGGALLAVQSLGISTMNYAPFVFSAWMSILLVIIYAYTGKFTLKINEEKVSQM